MRDDSAAPDGDKSSWQDWEIEHLVDKLCRDFPGKSPTDRIKEIVARRQNLCD